MSVTRSRSVILFAGIALAFLVAVAGLLLAPLLFGLTEPNANPAVRVAGVASMRQSFLLLSGGILAGFTLLQTVERDRITQAKHADDAVEADRRFEELSLQRDLAERRFSFQHRTDVEKELRTRFVTASQLLASDNAVVRTSGAYAMAALADEWANDGNLPERQVCIDILCAYIRTRSPVGADDAGVRASILRIIASHLSSVDEGSWQGAEFDLSTSLVNFDIDFSQVSLARGTTINFDGSTFRSGTFHSFDALLTGGFISFRRAQFDGANMHFSFLRAETGGITFSGAQFQSGTLFLTHAHVLGGTLDFSGSIFSGSQLFVSQCSFDRPGQVRFDRCVFVADPIHFEGVTATAKSLTFRGSIDRGARPRFIGMRSGELQSDDAPFEPPLFA